ncbi:ATP-binding cassette domain-containing protein [Trebonia sp.]|uniref:ABC transporter permease subunit n=1 Tax=Trebonia sp. TaxID=2767075 RepID=UPI002609FA03|nr:ATP-binding cassette domain-containing protein [Trebonia sp.]
MSSLVSVARTRSLVPTGVVLAGGVLIVLIYGLQYTGSVFVLAACYAIVTAGMAVQIGFSQQIAFSQSVFMGVGAYGVAMLNQHYNMPVLVATPIVMVGAALAALLLGSVVTRASGLALAVATLMLPLIAVGYVSNTGFLGGPVGAPLTGALWPSSSTNATLIGGGLVTIAFLALAVFVASRILTSDIGLELFVLGVDEHTAAAMGVRTPRRKLELFVLGCVFAALGGAAYAGTQQFVPETLIDPTAELALLIMLFIGGRRSVIGAVIGALVIQYLQGASNWVSVNILVVEGLLLTVVLLTDPEGLAGIVHTGVAWVRNRRAQAIGQAESPAAMTGPAARAEAAGVPLAPTDAAGYAGASPAPGTPLAPGVTPLLQCRDIGKEYGGLSVLDDIAIALPKRGLFGLCGPNGAGKTTLLNVIGGSVQPSRGQVLLDGEDITRKLPHQRFYLGISRTFQAVHLIKGRTVLDNVAVSCLASHQSGIVTRIARSKLGEARDKAAQTLSELGMQRMADREVSSLTLENQRMVELARALAPRPRLLLLDEPASGLSEQQRYRLADMLRQSGEMTCVLLVEHDLDLVAQVSQRIFVLSGGRLVFDGGPDDFRASPIVNSLLVGL